MTWRNTESTLKTPLQDLRQPLRNQRRCVPCADQNWSTMDESHPVLTTEQRPLKQMGPKTGLLMLMPDNPEGKYPPPYYPVFTFELPFEEKEDRWIVRDLEVLVDLDRVSGFFGKQSFLLVYPNEHVETCVENECRTCPLWMLCSPGGLEMGTAVNFYIKEFHLKKRCQINGQWLPKGSHVKTLTGRPYAIHSISSDLKDQLLPQTRKDQ